LSTVVRITVSPPKRFFGFNLHAKVVAGIVPTRLFNTVTGKFETGRGSRDLDPRRCTRQLLSIGAMPELNAPT
jgi:hypothetical protein